MKLRWMAWLILTHRWMGIVLCLMMTVWCLSGAVLLYFGLPHLNAGERLARLPSLEASSIRVAPAEAAAKAGENAFRIRLSMLGDRPVYRVNTGNVFGRWTLVYADNGEVFYGFSPDEVHRSFAVHPAASCAIVNRRNPTPPIAVMVLTSTSPSAVRAG